MTNDEARMTKEARSSNDHWPKKHRVFTAICHSSFSALPFLLIAVSLLALLCGCASPHKPSKPHIVGKIVGNSYISSRGDFSVPCPVSPEVGGRILRDNPQGVTFTDNWGSKITIYSTPFNAQSQMMNVLQTQGPEKALETFAGDNYGNSIVPHYHPDILNGTVSFIVLRPVGPKTGVAAFIHDNRIYLVETDLLPGVQLLSGDDDKSQGARDEWLENRAMELLQTIEIK